jgi:hypothetical protein
MTGATIRYFHPLRLRIGGGRDPTGPDDARFSPLFRLKLPVWLIGFSRQCYRLDFELSGVIPPFFLLLFPCYLTFIFVSTR